MSAVQTSQLCPTSVFAVQTHSELTLQQRTAIYLIDQNCINAETVIGIGAIKRLGIFHSHAQAVYQINELAENGWLLVHEGCFKPSPKAINWLIAQGARAGLSAVTQEQNHVV
ncbi:hypothetical protein EIK76_00270 [Rheinheimera mesophila]|uniref:Uncharacterized protein n=1 Tax=Rheinheimera mesophila TaxID=1547515 RepID=A0A3P3QMW1_9GAMM|nr:hypothetical protein [Rheinheimera mesophila]KKL00273.1 hypothetical protein SD53_15875 [Rheinheimera mesophila]RRJ22556.1 hypothetical protein EIK76_00270 [Rheinheimera mesophila]